MLTGEKMIRPVIKPEEESKEKKVNLRLSRFKNYTSALLLASEIVNWLINVPASQSHPSVQEM